MTYVTSTTTARSGEAEGDGLTVVTPTERPASNVIDFLSRAGSRLLRPWSADGVGRLFVALGHVGRETPDTGWGLSGGRLHAFDEWFADEKAVLREYGCSAEEIQSHELTAVIAWMHADATAAELMCSACGHSPHAGGGENYGPKGPRTWACAAIRELDDGPRICGCEEDNA